MSTAGHGRLNTVYEITCDEQQAQQLVSLTVSLPQDQVGPFLSRAYPVLYAGISAAGLTPAGPPIARYRVDQEAFHVTAGVPFMGDFIPAPPAQIHALPAGLVASTVHVGSYEGLPTAFHAVIEWVGAHGYRIAADPWERYLDGPEVAEPRTQVCFPVVAA